MIESLESRAVQIQIKQEVVFKKDKHRLAIGCFKWEDITNKICLIKL